MPVRHVLKVNGYGGRQAKGNEKRQCFKGWETLVKKKCNRYDNIFRRSAKKVLTHKLLLLVSHIYGM